MPDKPLKPCASPGCPALTRSRFCERHRKEASAAYNRFGRNPALRSAYGSAWRRQRERFLAENPLCESCLRVGRVVPATEAHHVIPLSDGGSSSPENLSALCKHCHSRTTAKEGGRWGNHGAAKARNLE